MSNNFKAFEGGIRLAPKFASDPVTGKRGDIYYNTSTDQLRMCINSSPVWIDLNLVSGTQDGATLRWDSGAQKWTENTLIRTNGNTLYTPDSDPGTDLTIAAGSALSGNNNGGNLILNSGIGQGGGSAGDIILQPGTGPTAGNIVFDSVLARGQNNSGTDGSQLVIRAGSTLTNGFLGGDLHLEGGNNVAVSPVQEVQAINFIPAPDAGTFVLTINSVNTSTLNWNSSNLAVQSALNAASPSDTVTVTGSIASGTLTITFDSPGPRSGAISVFNNSLTESSNPIVVNVSTVTPGVTAVALQYAPVHITGRKIRLNARSSSDPVGGLEADIYYNTSEERFRYFDGTNWRKIASPGALKVTCYDPLTTSVTSGLAIVDPYVIDGHTIVDGDTVMFSNLSVGNNRVYKASVSGGAISWSAQPAFEAGFDPEATDQIAIQKGTSFGRTVGLFDAVGNSWDFNFRTRYFNGTDYWEGSALFSSSLTNNQVTPAVITQFGYFGSENVIIPYSLIRGSTKETGQIYITTNGTDISCTNSFSSTGSSGIGFSADLNAGNIRLLYVSDNSGSSGAIKFIVNRWSDSPGGPAGVPSYTGIGGGGSVTGSGSAGQIAYWASPSAITSNSNFVFDNVNSLLNLGGLKITTQQTLTLFDNQTSATNLVLLPSSDYHAIVEYGVARNGQYRTGRLLVSQDGATGIGFSDDYVETGSVGVLFSAVVSAGSIQLQYITTNLGVDGTFKYSIHRWA